MSLRTTEERNLHRLQGRHLRLSEHAAGQKMIDEADAAEAAARQSRLQHADETASSAAASQNVHVGHQKIRRTDEHAQSLIGGLQRATLHLKQTLPSGGGRIKDLPKNYKAAMEAARKFTISHQQTHPTALRAEQRDTEFVKLGFHHPTLHVLLSPKNKRVNEGLGDFLAAREEAENIKYTSKKHGRPDKLKSIVKKPADHRAITKWIKSQYIPTAAALVVAPMVQAPSKQGGRKTRKRKRRRKRKTRKHRKKKRTHRRKPKKRHRRTRKK